MGTCPGGLALVTARGPRPAAAARGGHAGPVPLLATPRTHPPAWCAHCHRAAARAVSLARPVSVLRRSREPGTSVHAEGARRAAVLTAGSSRLSSASPCLPSSSGLLPLPCWACTFWARPGVGRRPEVPGPALATD